jgi:ArsR family transcriptional regulator
MTDAAQKRQFLACLSDPSRFNLVTTLAGGPRCVTELAGLVGLSQSCTTRHLQALLREGIVSGERQGKRVVYALRDLEPDAHPVLLWACGPSGALERGVAHAGSPSESYSRTAGAGPPLDEVMSPGESSSAAGPRRTRRPSAIRLARADRREESIEVTDALIVAHDSGWRDDEGVASPPVMTDARGENLPFEAGSDDSRARHDRADPGPPAHREFVRAVREDLDDFLL